MWLTKMSILHPKMKTELNASLENFSEKYACNFHSFNFWWSSSLEHTKKMLIFLSL